MKRCKVFVIPVVLLLFMVLPAMLYAAQEGVGQYIVADPTGNKSHRSHIDPLHLMMGNGADSPSYPFRERDGMMDMGIKHPAYHAFREKRPDRKSDVVNTSSDTWKIETVDASNYFTNFSSRSIAVDSNNNPHIVYGFDHLYYAYYDRGLWHYDTIDASPGVGEYASLVLDEAGKVHISYYDSTNDDLKYATNASGSWITTTVDSAGYVGKYTSIAVDGTGKVHISYYDDTNKDLKYATNISGSWVTITVASRSDTGYYTSIAVDGANKVHIGYCSGRRYEDEWNLTSLKYTTNASGKWVTSAVDSIGGYYGSTSLAVDGADKVHISYYDDDWTNYGFKYATNASGSWVTTTVDSAGDAGWVNSVAIALDGAGKVHISYYDMPSGTLKYATNAINKPTVKTKSATKVTDNSATLNGLVNGHGLTTRVWFQYGTTSGSYNRNSSKKTTKGSINKKVSISIGGLSSQMTYYYRIAAKNKNGTSYGDEKSFTTQ